MFCPLFKDGSPWRTSLQTRKTLSTSQGACRPTAFSWSCHSSSEQTTGTLPCRICFRNTFISLRRSLKKWLSMYQKNQIAFNPGLSNYKPGGGRQQRQGQQGQGEAKGAQQQQKKVRKTSKSAQGRTVLFLFLCCFCFFSRKVFLRFVQARPEGSSFRSGRAV